MADSSTTVNPISRMKCRRESGMMRKGFPRIHFDHSCYQELSSCLITQSAADTRPVAGLAHVGPAFGSAGEAPCRQRRRDSVWSSDHGIRRPPLARRVAVSRFQPAASDRDPRRGARVPEPGRGQAQGLSADHPDPASLRANRSTMVRELGQGHDQDEAEGTNDEEPKITARLGTRECPGSSPGPTRCGTTSSMVKAGKPMPTWE